MHITKCKRRLGAPITAFLSITLLVFIGAV